VVVRDRLNKRYYKTHLFKKLLEKLTIFCLAADFDIALDIEVKIKTILRDADELGNAARDHEGHTRKVKKDTEYIVYLTDVKGEDAKCFMCAKIWLDNPDDQHNHLCTEHCEEKLAYGSVIAKLNAMDADTLSEELLASCQKFLRWDIVDLRTSRPPLPAKTSSKAASFKEKKQLAAPPSSSSSATTTSTLSTSAAQKRMPNATRHHRRSTSESLLHRATANNFSFSFFPLSRSHLKLSNIYIVALVEQQSYLFLNALIFSFPSFTHHHHHHHHHYHQLLTYERINFVSVQKFFAILNNVVVILIVVSVIVQFSLLFV
jgi:hypothetical protein